MTPDSGHPAFTGWLAGLVLGVGGGFLVLIFPTLGLLYVALGVVGVLRSRRPVAGGSGLLTGMGSTILVLLTRAQLDCEAFDAAPNQGCTAPDLTPLIVIGGALLVMGVVLFAAALAGSHARWRGAR